MGFAQMVAKVMEDKRKRSMDNKYLLLVQYWGDNGPTSDIVEVISDKSKIDINMVEDFCQSKKVCTNDIETIKLIYGVIVDRIDFKDTIPVSNSHIHHHHNC